MKKNFYSSDYELLEAIKRKDRSAFKYIYKFQTLSLKKYILNNNGTQSDADEIEQEVIIHLYEKIVNDNFVLHSNTKLATYLFAVGKRMWLKKLGKGKLTFDTDVPDLAESSFTDEEDLDKDELVYTAISSLDNFCKDILIKFYYNNLSMREIAADIDMTEDNVRKRKYKCLQKIRKIFKK